MPIDTSTAGFGDYSAMLVGSAIGATTPSAGGLAGLLATGGSSASTPTFGPAALLSVRIPAPADSGGDLYTNLAGLAYGNSAAVQESPQQQAAEKKVIQQAFDLIDAAHADQARDLVADAVKKMPGRATLIHVQGMIEMAAGNYSKAEQFFRKAGAIDPSLGSLDQAENAKAMQGDDATAMARAKRLLSQKDTQNTGLQLLDAITTRSPQNTAAVLMKADALMKGGDQLKALVSYSQAVSIADEDQLHGLESRFTDLVSKSPDDAFARNLLGKVQLRLGENDAALATLQAATQLAADPTGYQVDEAQAQVAVGRDQLASGNIAEAVASFEDAYTLAPDDANVRLARAEGYTARAESRARSGDFNHAVSDYQTAANNAQGDGADAVALRDRIAHGAYALGRQLENRRIESGGDVGQEIVAFQTAFDLDPKNSTYREKLASTRKAIGDEDMADNKYADAAASYRRAYELQASNTSYRDLAINAYTQDGDQKLTTLSYDDAIAAYRQAFSLNSSNDSSRTKLANAYTLAGVSARDNDHNRSSAAAYFREALHLYPDNQQYQDNYNSVYP